jgi:dihydrofolate reductase
MSVAEREATRRGENEIMIIGGAEIFDLFSEEVEKVYLTEIDAAPEGDAYFRRDFSDWELTSEQVFKTTPDGDEYDFTLRVYQRPSRRCVQPCDAPSDRRALVAAE